MPNNSGIIPINNVSKPSILAGIWAFGSSDPKWWVSTSVDQAFCFEQELRLPTGAASVRIARLRKGRSSEVSRWVHIFFVEACSGGGIR